MEKHIIGENGISYTLGMDDIYYPDLSLGEESEYVLGKFGLLRKSYLKEYHKAVYSRMLLMGELDAHLQQVDKECNERMEVLVSQTKEKEGVTELLKEKDQMEWTRRMNGILQMAEELVMQEMIYL